MNEEPKNIHIFPEHSLQAIHPSQVGANFEGPPYYITKNDELLRDTYCTNVEIYEFINQYLNSNRVGNTGKKIIIFEGKPKMGKTLFVRKSLGYMKERGKIDGILYINLKHHNVSINNIIWFLSEFGEKVK